MARNNVDDNGDFIFINEAGTATTTGAPIGTTGSSTPPPASRPSGNGQQLGGPLGLLEDFNAAMDDIGGFFNDPFGTKAASERADQTIENERLRLQFERFQALSKQRQDATQASLAAGTAKGKQPGKQPGTPAEQGKRADQPGGISAARKPAGQTLGDQGDFLGL